MPSFLDQYKQREGVFANTPAAPAPAEPAKPGIVSSIKSFFTGSKPVTPAPMSLLPEDARGPYEKPKSFVDQYKDRSGVFKDPAESEAATPEASKAAGRSAFLDETPETLRRTGESAYNFRVQPGPMSRLPEKPQITMPTQEQLDNPAIAKAYREAIEANKPPTLVKRLADAYDSYAQGLKRVSTNVAIGELGTVESMLGAFEWAGVDSAKAPADKINDWIDAAVKEQGDVTFADKLAQGVGSSAVFFIPGLGVAKGAQTLAVVSPRLALLFGGSVSGTLEAMTEAGNTYRAILKTKDDESAMRRKSIPYDPTQLDADANEAAWKTFIANMILVNLTNRLGVFNPDASGFVRRMVFSSPIEAVQEAGQQIIQNVAQKKEDPFEGTWDSFLIGGIVGGVQGGFVSTLIDTQSGDIAQKQQIVERTAAAEQSNTVFRWAGNTEAETTLGANRSTGTVGEGSYFAFDPESSADFGTQLETFSLPQDLKVLDFTAGVEPAAGFAGSVDSLNPTMNPLVREAYQAGYTSDNLLEFAQSKGFDAVKFYADDGVSKWLAVRPDLKLAPATAEASIEAAGGWAPGMKEQFDTALAHKDAETVRALLSEVPQEYQTRFAAEIQEITGQPLQTAQNDAGEALAVPAARIPAEEGEQGQEQRTEAIPEEPSEENFAPKEDEQDTVFFHGSTPENAQSIIQSGFNTENVALTPDIEEALEYANGNIAGVVAVRIKKSPREVNVESREPLYDPLDVRVLGMAPTDISASGTEDVVEEARTEEPPKEQGRVLELTAEDLNKEIQVETERLGGDVFRSRAAENVRRNVRIGDQKFPRPDQLVTKTQVRYLLDSAGTDVIDTRIEETNGQKYLTFKSDRGSFRLRPSALGLVESQLNAGDTIRISAQNLKEKGTSLRARGSGGALAFNIKNLVKGTDTKEGNAEIDKIVRRSEIAEELASKLGVPVRTGRFKDQALGIFKPWAHTIRLKSKLGNLRIPVLVHESAHFLDYTMLGRPTKTKAGKSWISTKFISNLIPQAELDPLLEEYGGTPKSKKREAFAEFIRFWVTEPGKAASKAPQFAKIWEDEILPDFPEVRDTLLTTRRDWERWNEMPAIAKVVSQISFKTKSIESLADVKDLAVKTWHDLLNQWTDDLYPIKRFTDLARKEGVKLDLEEDPYILARLSRGWVGKAGVFLEKGTFSTRFWKEVNGKAEPVFTGKGFSQIIAPIVNKHATEDFAAYLVSRRAIDLNSRDIHSGVETKTAETAMKELDAKYPEFKQAAADLDAYQNSLLDYLFEAGLLTAEAHNNMRNLMKDYVPFHRVIEEAEKKGLSGRTLADIRSPIKKIKGSDRDIINPLESIVKNTYSLINAAERNRVAMAMVNLSTKHPELAQLFEKIPEQKVKVAQVKVNDLIDQVTKGDIAGLEAQMALGGMGEHIVNIFRPSFTQGDNVVTVMIGGKPQHFQVDPELYKAIHATEVEDVGLIWKLISYPARWLRAGATLTPEFIVRNPARDLFSALVYSDYGFMPPVDVPRGLYGAIAKDNDYWLWRMGGGEQSMLVSVDRTTLKKSYEDLAAAHDFSKLGMVKRGARYVLNPIETLRMFSEFTEKMTRVGEAKKAISRGANPLEAGFAAREVTLDFAKIGSKARSANMVVAFFNAQIQGSVRMVRAFREHPYRTTGRTLAFITLPSILLTLWNMQEDDWDEIPQWQKNLFWMLKIGDTWYRWPKPFELGILFGSVPERAIESIVENDPEVWPELRKAILDGATPGILPTGIIPIIENITNYSFFLQRNIVPDSLEQLPAFAQYTSYTSETAKTIGKWMNVSPAQIDNLVSGYFAGLGRYATEIIDKGINLVKGEKAATEPEKTAADIPLLRAFVVRDPVTSSGESLNRFYLQAERARAAKNYYGDLLERGRQEEAKQWYADHVAEISLTGYYEQTRKQIAALRTLQNRVRDDTKMDAETKRKKLDELGRTMTDLAQKAISIQLKEE